MPMQPLLKKNKITAVPKSVFKGSYLKRFVIQRKFNAQFNSLSVREQTVQKVFKVSLLFFERSPTENGPKFNSKP